MAKSKRASASAKEQSEKATGAPTYIDPGLWAAAAPGRDPGLRILSVDELVTDPRNARTHDEKNLAAVRSSLERFRQRQAIVVQRRGESLVVRAGAARLQAFRDAAWRQIVALVIDESDESAAGFGIADNRTAELAGWDAEILAGLLREQRDAGFDTESLGFAADDLSMILPELASNEGKGTDPGRSIGGLLARFGFPPFSVLDARSGRWIERKRAWLDVLKGADLSPGVEVAEGLEKRKTFASDFYRRKTKAGQDDTAAFADGYEVEHYDRGVSKFDPVLVEIALRWFCRPGGYVLDPFAGGPTAGLVSGILGASFFGVDISAEQVAANRSAAERVEASLRKFGSRALEALPTWVEANSAQTNPEKLFGTKFDLVFTSPPYHDLIRYSNAVGDLSTVKWRPFVDGYALAVENACGALLENRFAVVLVSEIRAPDGSCRGLVPLTIRLFQQAGLVLVNDAVIVQPTASIPFRAGRAFAASRKLGRCHQNVLVFLKGDAEKAREELGEVRPIDFELEEAGNDERADDLSVNEGADS